MVIGTMLFMAVVFAVADRGTHDVVADIKRERLPEVPPSAASRLAGGNPSRQSAEDQKHKQPGHDLQDHELGQLEMVAEKIEARQPNVRLKRQMEIGKVPDVMENVFFTGGCHGRAKPFSVRLRRLEVVGSVMRKEARPDTFRSPEGTDKTPATRRQIREIRGAGRASGRSPVPRARRASETPSPRESPAEPRFLHSRNWRPPKTPPSRESRHKNAAADNPIIPSRPADEPGRTQQDKPQRGGRQCQPAASRPGHLLCRSARLYGCHFLPRSVPLSGPVPCPGRRIFRRLDCLAKANRCTIATAKPNRAPMPTNHGSVPQC